MSLAEKAFIEARGTVSRAVQTRLIPRFTAPSFLLDGVTFDYFRQDHSWVSERIVELPLAIDAIRRAGPSARVLEVGNVMSQYIGNELPADYTVVDKYEVADGVDNIDVVDHTAPPYDLIVSISTFEHVGLDEQPRDFTKARTAVRHAHSLLKPGGAMLATWALSYNKDLDDAILDGSLGQRSTAYLRRETGLTNRWASTDAETAHASMFGASFLFANAVAVLRW